MNNDLYVEYVYANAKEYQLIEYYIRDIGCAESDREFLLKKGWHHIDIRIKTPFKDVDDIDIYENDIVGFGDDTPTSSDGLYGCIGTVFMSENIGQWMVMLTDGRSVPLVDNIMFSDKKTRRKVYGNIYEHKHLIGDEQ